MLYMGVSGVKFGYGFPSVTLTTRCVLIAASATANISSLASSGA